MRARWGPLLAFAIATAAAVAHATFEPTEPIPSDSSITVGALPNGLRYYAQRNDWPQNRVELRLVVLAGSVLEDDDQRGLAHFVEHMAFNGSTHFPPGEVRRYFESIGARFGADLNANTGFDQTIYILDVPAAGESLVVRGVQLLADFAAGVTFADSEVAKERGVVLEEWRGRLGAGDRMNRVILPVLYQGSRYADRLPIGDPDIIRGAAAQRIRDFHAKWYKPNRMAVCIVGSIDPERAVALVRQEFGFIPAAPEATPSPRFDVPFRPGMRYAIASDPEARGSSVSLLLERPRTTAKTMADVRDNTIRTLLYAMFNERFRELARTPDAPFLGAAAGAGTLGKSVRTFQLNASVQDGKCEGGLRALGIELRRARLHGFGAAELERTKSIMVAGAERAARERDRTENRSLIAACITNVTDSLPMTSATQRAALLKEVLPTITVDDVNTTLAGLMQDQGRIVVVQAPQKEGQALPSEQTLGEILAAAETSMVKPWFDKVADRPLLTTMPKPGSVRSRRAIPEIGVTILTLSNGVEAWLRPTDFKKDEILFSARGPGGLSRVDPARYQESNQAVAIVHEAGYGGLTPVETSKLLAGKLLSVTPFVGDFSQGFSGSTTPQDLETALQLVYLTVTSPNDRPEALDIVRKRLREAIANRESDPDEAFSNEVARVTTCDHYMERPIPAATIETLQFEPALAFYRDQFANAADFSMFVVGAFEEATLIPLLEKYVASLPSAGKPKSKFKKRDYQFPKGVVTSDVRKGREPQSQTSMAYFASPGRDRQARVTLNMATEILQIHLREILREQLGTTYSVRASFSDLQPIDDYGYVSVDFGGAPENRDRMVEVVQAEIQRLTAAGPTAEDLQKVQEIARRELEVNEKRNGWWLGQLVQAKQFGWDPRSIAAARQRIEAMNLQSVHAAFSTYLATSRRTVVSLFPETEAAGDDGSQRR